MLVRDKHASATATHARARIAATMRSAGPLVNKARIQATTPATGMVQLEDDEFDALMSQPPMRASLPKRIAPPRAEEAPQAAAPKRAKLPSSDPPEQPAPIMPLYAADGAASKNLVEERAAMVARQRAAVDVQRRIEHAKAVLAREPDEKPCAKPSAARAPPSRPATAEPDGKAREVLRDASGGSKRSFLDAFGEVKATAAADTMYASMADAAADAELYQRLDALESREKAVEQLAGVFSQKVVAHKCETCRGAKLFAFAPKLCYEKGHKVAKVPGEKRRYECSHCHHRVYQVVAEGAPGGGSGGAGKPALLNRQCDQCGNNTWLKCSFAAGAGDKMLKSIDPEGNIADATKLKPRGTEHARFLKM